ncbi:MULTISPECIES: magnesium transporter CorA family protein [Gammaproteobacteria]|uniref:Magnesium transporter CorA family protein n=1 Tax=Acinetobacter johnsonii TaxID=40214 RepID=A0AA42SD73_ACIJO|nr:MULTISPECIES: magnesium transporter CorA family protein [Gammaproteobacteria]NWK48040.1 magnesium transporter CorA family protein [Acinetobacter sp. SwsAc7]HAS9274015.1 magnesium transporter CorA family protein [Salmonella enterica subsp. enterica serovar Typhimurium]MBC6625806.1 magnesium transporter CorA family protein [Pseudomonas sp.]MBC6677317.1 magnesium transporter CorA family protein [Acinetobacter sp.]MCU4325845.1 magnesium transporter CorA family protein [Acinetobacter johnsonii]
MQSYYFYQHPTAQHTYVQKQPIAEQEAEFIWVECSRDDVVNRAEHWQQDIYAATGLWMNEYHLRDILNLEHPCAFDTLEDYDLLIFRKLITPDDQIKFDTQATEKHERVFGLATTPISFMLTPQVLITVREQGNKEVESYIQRMETVLSRPIEEHNKPRKLPATPLDLTLRLLNNMVDGYLDLRVPLTRRVEFWQQELLQGHRRFTKWHQLLQENMAFQQVENLCEEQIETLQELRDEIVDNYSHLKGKKRSEKQDIMLVRVDDLTSHIERIQKHTIRLRNAVQAAIDLHFSAIANQTNENMRILAIITAIFAPLTLLTGVYGMNFEFIPGLKSPTGFWIMLGIMLMTTLILLYYFYRRHLVGRGEKSVIDMLAQQHADQHMNLFWFIDYEPIKQTVKGTIKDLEKITKLK